MRLINMYTPNLYPDRYEFRSIPSGSRWKDLSVKRSRCVVWSEIGSRYSVWSTKWPRCAEGPAKWSWCTMVSVSSRCAVSSAKLSLGSAKWSRSAVESSEGSLWTTIWSVNDMRSRSTSTADSVASAMTIFCWTHSTGTFVLLSMSSSNLDF